MLLRERMFIWFFALVAAAGFLDAHTQIGNRLWEKYSGFSGRFVVVQENTKKLGYVNGRSRLVITPKFDDGATYFNKGLSPAAVNKTWGYIDASGQWIIPPQFLAAHEFYEGLAAVLVKASAGQRPRFGFINESGKLVIPAEYYQVSRFSNGLAAAQSTGLWGFIDSQGQWIIPPEYDQVLDFQQGLAAVKKLNQWGFIDTRGLALIDFAFDEVMPFSEGLAAVRAGKFWGYINTLGKWVAAPQWQKAGRFSDGLAAVDDGYINDRGELTISSKGYSLIRDFSEGLAAVKLKEQKAKKSGLWGYIDRSGRFVIPARFELAFDFKGGLARVARDKNNLYRGYVFKNGKLVWDPADWEKSENLKRNIQSIVMLLIFFFAVSLVLFLKNRNKRLYYLRTIA